MQNSFEAIRVWTKTRIAESAGQWLSGSLFWPIWLRFAGMKLGPGCEISTIIDILPETISIGGGSFFADGIYLCGPWRHRGTITIAPSGFGRDTFLGNHAVIPAEHQYPEKLFVGVATVPDAMQIKPDTAWFGHPPMQLPRRQVVASDKTVTHNPAPLRRATRLFWELLRFTLVCYPVFLGIIWFILMNSASNSFGPLGMAVLIAPAFSAGVAIALCIAIIIAKWILLGRAKPGQHAFWSCWCGRWDFLYMAWEYWGTFVLTRLDGTLLLNIFLRLTGVRIGKRVVLDFGFHQFVDPDMIIIDDDATVSCQFQSHSFEDRVLKLDYIHVGRGSTLRDNAIVFFGVRIGDGATVSPHSVVMKNDVLESGGTYVGNPSNLA
jgi:non-ribosomal peptide synthetase-like protein